MRICAALLLSLTWTVSVADADADALAKLVKERIVQGCGDDEDCAYAVKMQFDGCHRRSRKVWQAYMDASASEEDRYLDQYFIDLYACILDENGEPYFEHGGG